MLLVGANSSWRPGACSPLCIANRRQETAPTKGIWEYQVVWFCKAKSNL